MVKCLISVNTGGREMATLSLSLEVSKLYKAEFYVQSKNTPMLISKLRALITNRSRTEE
jgi:hypothetical protein